MNTLTHFLETHRGWIVFGVLLSMLFWESLAPFFSFFRHHLKERCIHGLMNFVLWGFNAFLTAVFFATVWAWAAETAGAHAIGILQGIALPAWAELLLAIGLFDLWTYWWHRINHRIHFLWRFHRVHHSDPRMDVTTANRFHFGEITLSALLRIPVIFLVGAEFWQLVVYEALMFPVVQFHHANVALPAAVDRILRVFIVTPAMHKVHHSRCQPETDSNYTSFLSVWDRIFGSFRHRTDLEAVRYGLDGYDSPERQSLWGMIRTPRE